MTWCLVRRSHQLVQQVLVSAPLLVDPVGLSRGNVQVMPLTARRQLTQAFDDSLPPALQDRLVLQQVQVMDQPLDHDPDHWLGSRQPKIRPLIVMTARLEGLSDQAILIRQGVEVILD